MDNNFENLKQAVINKRKEEFEKVIKDRLEWCIECDMGLARVLSVSNEFEKEIIENILSDMNLKSEVLGEDIYTYIKEDKDGLLLKEEITKLKEAIEYDNKINSRVIKVSLIGIVSGIVLMLSSLIYLNSLIGYILLTVGLLSFILSVLVYKFFTSDL